MIGEVAGVGTGFKGAINYLLLGKKEEPNPDRAAWTELRNLPTDNPKLAPRLMRATANQSARCRKPLYHLVLSWREDENPTDEMMRAHVDETLRDLELHDHQAFIAAHKDTRHRHVHLIINRVHPETTRAWSRSMDYARIELSIRRQLEERGLSYVPGRHNDPEKFGLKSKHVKRSEYRKAIHNGKERPPDHWSTGQINERREPLLRSFDSARSWDQLSRMLMADGIALKRKGQGIVLEGKDGFMKLSELRKDIRLGALETLYGEPFADDAARTPDVLVPARHTERRKAVAPTPTVARKPKPADTESADETNAPPDPSEVERLREEARLERIKRREEELARRAEQRRKGSGVQGDDSGAASSSRTPDMSGEDRAASAPPTANDPTLSPRGEAFAALGKTREALDLAKRLHRMGLMDDEALERARREVENAQDSLEPHLSMGERLTNEIGEALRNLARADQKAPRPEPLPPKKLKRPKFKKRDRDDRER